MNLLRGRILFFSLSLFVITGCVGTYNPVIHGRYFDGEEAFRSAVKILRDNGYELTVDETLLIAFSNEKNLGFKFWKKSNEKWNIDYKLRLEIRCTNNGYYWRVDPIIQGSRAGRQDRIFSRYDFDDIHHIVTSIERLLSHKLSAKKYASIE